MSLDKTNKKLADKYRGYPFMYAEYPNKNFWSADFTEKEFKTALKGLPSYKKNAPLMLYVHIPFCPQACFYCSCYKITTTDYERVKDHLKFMFGEIDLLNKFFNENSINPNFKQVHLGGGSPSYLREKEFDKLIEKLDSVAKIENLDEFAIETDPRQVDREKMLYYHSKGINRVSFGVQEFNLEVQKAVNRVQPPELMEDLLAPDVKKHFNGVSFDILYGLPKQTKSSFRKTTETILKFSPDRIALISFNYSPHLHENQRLIKEDEIPDNFEKTEIFFEAADTFLSNGYVRVGLEHFVKPTDNLAKAWSTKQINWNMCGYSPGDANKIIGVGPSSESRITDDYYFQNFVPLEDYERVVAKGNFPIYRGHKLSKEDLIRRDITVGLRSNLFLDLRAIEEKHNIDFRKFFKKEMGNLDEFIKDGLITVSDDKINVTEQGMPFVSFVCMNFDAYHQK